MKNKRLFALKLLHFLNTSTTPRGSELCSTPEPLYTFTPILILRLQSNSIQGQFLMGSCSVAVVMLISTFCVVSPICNPSCPKLESILRLLEDGGGWQQSWRNTQIQQPKSAAIDKEPTARMRTMARLISSSSSINTDSHVCNKKQTLVAAIWQLAFFGQIQQFDIYKLCSIGR